MQVKIQLIISLIQLIISLILSYFQKINNLKTKSSNKLNIINMKNINMKNITMKNINNWLTTKPIIPTIPPIPPTPEEILESLEELLKTIVLNSHNLPIIIKYLMEEVEKTTLKGKKKTNLVLYTLKKSMQNLEENEDSIVLLILIDNGTIENIINVINNASKGKYKINILSNKKKSSLRPKIGCIVKTCILKTCIPKTCIPKTCNPKTCNPDTIPDTNN